MEYIELYKKFENEPIDSQLLSDFLNGTLSDESELGTDDIRSICELILDRNPADLSAEIIETIWLYFKDSFGSTYKEDGDDWVDTDVFQEFDSDFYEYHYGSILLISKSTLTPNLILEEIRDFVVPLAENSELEEDALEELEAALSKNPNL